MNDIDLPAEVKAQYINMRVLADGRICGVHRLLYHWTLHVDINEYGYEDRYCYESVADAIDRRVTSLDGTSLEELERSGSKIGFIEVPSGTNKGKWVVAFKSLDDPNAFAVLNQMFESRIEAEAAFLRWAAERGWDPDRLQ
jgi:hypothetical protein